MKNVELQQTKILGINAHSQYKTTRLNTHNFIEQEGNEHSATIINMQGADKNIII